MNCFLLLEENFEISVSRPTVINFLLEGKLAEQAANKVSGHGGTSRI
jgi:hypothetical protein